MTQENKPEIRSGLDEIVVRRLREIEDSPHSDIRRFPLVFKKLCRNFSISKQECWSILFALRDSGIIEIIPYHGIKIKETDTILTNRKK